MLNSNFVKCGIAGWCLEILFTGCHSIQKKERTMFGQTSLLMFPIYGTAAVFAPLYRLIQKNSVFSRGCIYTVCIYIGEYLSGSLLRKFRCCPWDYSHAKLNINGLIRLDFAPFWFLTGLLMEKITCYSQRSNT